MDHWDDMDTELCFFDAVVNNSCLLSDESRDYLLDLISERRDWCEQEGILGPTAAIVGKFLETSAAFLWDQMY